MKLTLTERLQQDSVLVAPGVYDALTAVLAERSGFEGVFLSGAALAYSRLGRPDIGLLTSVELADAVANICERIGVPVMVDADNGFGHAFHVARTVRQLERAGAAMIQLEDQSTSKGLDASNPRPLISIDLMVGKLQAALDARHNAGTLISARTDALFSLGLEAALERIAAYRATGADLLFVEGLRTIDEVRQVCAVADGVPVVFNRLEAMAEPHNAELAAAGVALLLRPDMLVNAMVRSGLAALQNDHPERQSDGLDAAAASAASIIDGQPFLDNGLRFTPLDPQN